MQSPAPASTLAEPPPAASPQLGGWICQQGLRSARMRCLLAAAGACRCQSAVAAAVLLLLLRRRLLFFFTFGHITYWYDHSQASNYCIYLIYLTSMQSPAPASSLAEPPPAASPQLGRRICQQGLRSARIRDLLLVLAAAAASTTAALASFFVWSHVY